MIPGCTPWTDVWMPACKESRLSGTICSRGYLPPPAVQECAVALLAADKGLAPNLQLRLPQLWSLPVLQQGLLAAGSARLVCAAFAQGILVSLKLVCILRSDLTVTHSILCRLTDVVWCMKRLGQ